MVNVWDVASALIVQRAGFPAMATSSSAVSSSLGYPDGERIPVAEMLAAVARITGRISVPVSADFEAGYADDLDGLADSVRELLQTGAVGLNLEDGVDPETGLLRTPERAMERIRAVRDVARENGVPLVINARTDVFLEGGGSPDALLADAIARLGAYRDAGADCLFPIGMRDPDAIRTLARQLDHPVNILAGPGAPSVDELAVLGVGRVSLGGGPQRAALATLAAVAEELHDHGTYGAMQNMLTHRDLDDLLSASQPPTRG
jgi:2-methylisocitrate lyase-like PEP mutase family enzyme